MSSKNNKLKYSNKFQIMRLLSINAATTFLFSFVMLAAVALIALKGGVDEKMLSYIMYPLIACVSLLNAYVLARIIKLKGYIVGIASNFLFIISVLIMNVSLSDKPLGATLFIKIAVILLLGAVGGILGVNHKKRVR